MSQPQPARCGYHTWPTVMFFGFSLGPCREILQEIQRLRLEHEQASQPTPEKAQQNPTLLTELRLLRYPVLPLALLSGKTMGCFGAGGFADEAL